MQVLVVDDSATQRGLIRAFLGGRGLRFLEARNGVDALELARAEAPDLIVTDLNMPEMDGAALVRRLRESDEARLRRTPIIILTAEHGTPLFEEAERAGADAICLKPVGRSDLMAAALQHLGLR